MKTPAEVANHPKARLHRELVELLRAGGNISVAVVIWRAIRRKRELWDRVEHFGLSTAARQDQLNRIAFPEQNHAEVDAALQAGNSLRTLYALASGRAWVARDTAGQFKHGRKGLRVFVEKSQSDAQQQTLI